MIKILNHLLLYKLRSLTPAQIAAACQCSEGLENRLAEAASCTTFQDVVSATVTKRYPASRVRRLLMQLLLQQYRAMFDNAKDPAYIRVLAFNDRGRELLKEMLGFCSAACNYQTGPQRLGKIRRESRAAAFR